jgi:hypothetical protein
MGRTVRDLDPEDHDGAMNAIDSGCNPFLFFFSSRYYLRVVSPGKRKKEKIELEYLLCMHILDSTEQGSKS